MDDFVRIGKRVVNAKSCILTLLGVPFVGITATDFEDALSGELVYGAARDGTPLGEAVGKYEPSPGTITMLTDVFMVKFMPLLAALNLAEGSPGALGVARWPFVVQYVELGLPPMTVMLDDCRFVKAKDSYQEGVAALVTEITYQPMSISRNGLTLFDPTRI